jgi:agmatine/peptidylarginine deiminase
MPNLRLPLPRWSLLVLLPATVALTAVVLRNPPESHSAKRISESSHTISKKTGFGPAVDAAASGRIVGEFEHQDAIMLGFNELLEYHPKTLCNIVAAIGTRATILGLISDPKQEQRTVDLLASHGLATENVRFFLWPAISMWVRDFGPRTLVGDNLRLIDFNYHFEGREVENQLPLAMAAKYGMKIEPSQLTMEGGNLLSNGRGLCVSSSTLIEQNRPRGYDLQAIGAILQRSFRFTQWSYLPPLIGEPTGHVDMYFAFTSPTTVVVGTYDPAVDSVNAAQLDQAAQTMSQVLVEGEPVKVVRIPMPPRPDDKWRTYTNVIFANGALLVPQYPDVCPELDRRALEIYRELLPDWEVVGIDASSIINNRGSLHCLSRNLPALPGLDDAE